MRTNSVNTLVAVGMFAAVFAATGSAQQSMPQPAAEMAQLAYFEGSWTCTGKSFQTPMGPAGDIKGTVEMRKDLNGHYQSGTVKMAMANMPPMEGRMHVTYDTGKKQYIMLWVDNMGGRAQTASSGWTGDTIVYEGETHMAGQTIPSRDTFTKNGPTSMKHGWEAQMNGKWMALGEATCTKK